MQKFGWLQVLEVSAINIFYVHSEWFLKQVNLRLLAIKILKAFWSFHEGLHTFLRIFLSQVPSLSEFYL